VKKAAYKFGDRFHVLIETVEPGKARVVLRAKAQMDDPKNSAGEFCNEVLDQELRECIGSETDAVRNLLLAHAFSRTSLTDDGHESADYHHDPFHIGQIAEGGLKKT
jgi:His-Xaa-Ser system protein HxsD